MPKPRVILDTNILISYLLKPNPTISQAVRIASDNCTLLISQETFDELQSIIERFVKRGYVTIQEASEFLVSMVELAEWIKILETVQVCRDPKDDKFLELAVNGQAGFLITGDEDLLSLRSFKDTMILSASDFIKIFLSR